jgi:RNA polymerase sigma-70 factor (ECF subfamily)
MSQQSFDELMAQLRAGDQNAAEAIYHRYASRLIDLARSRLGDRLRQKVDPEDVAQSAWRSFFVRYAEGRFEINDWDSLWSLLTRITVCKCCRKAQHFRTLGRDIRREVAAAGDESHESWQAIAREPTPEEAAVLAETVEQLFAALDAGSRRVLELSLQHYTPSEVSAEAGVSERTVYRVLERVKGRLQAAIASMPE